MKKALLLLGCSLSTALSQAGTGKPCGDSYIHNTYVCHKGTGSDSSAGSVAGYFQEIPAGVIQRETVTVPASFQLPAGVTPVTVTQILDGVTFMAIANYQTTKLHLAGVKLGNLSPELNKQASQYLLRLMPVNSSVLVEFSPGQGAYVWVMGELMNLAVVEHGYAQLDTAMKGQYDDVLLTGLKYSQGKKLGLWAAPQAP